MRLVDEFLVIAVSLTSRQLSLTPVSSGVPFQAKSGITSCNNFRETAQVIAKVGRPSVPLLLSTLLRADAVLIACCFSLVLVPVACAQIAFKMFLGITAEPVKWREDGKQFSLVFKGVCSRATAAAIHLC